MNQTKTFILCRKLPNRNNMGFEVTVEIVDGIVTDNTVFLHRLHGKTEKELIDYCHENKIEYKEKQSNSNAQSKILIPEPCEPYMYNTPDDLNTISIGDVIELKFSNKRFRVKKEYRGKQLKFIVNNYMEHNWRRPTRRLALIPLDKQYTYTDKDILFLDDEDRFKCLMIDLFPCNRKPYAGWKNKTVRITNHITAPDNK